MNALTPLPIDEPQYPSINGLTDLQCAFVHELLADPRCQARAAIRAGYSAKSAHVTASRLMRHPIVTQAILDGTRVQLAGATAEALSVKLKLMRSAKSELVRDKAASDVLERAGLIAKGAGGSAGGVSITINLGDE